MQEIGGLKLFEMKEEGVTEEERNVRK